MVQRSDEPRDDGEGSFESSDDDERVGEAIEIVPRPGRAADSLRRSKSSLRAIPIFRTTFGRPSKGSSWSTVFWGSGPPVDQGRDADRAWDHRIESGQRIAGYGCKRAGSRRNGYGLRSRPHGARPAGRAQGAGCARHAGFHRRGGGSLTRHAPRPDCITPTSCPSSTSARSAAFAITQCSG